MSFRSNHPFRAGEPAFQPVIHQATQRQTPGLLLFLALACIPGCKRDQSADNARAPASKPVTLYCSVDEAFARQVIEQYRAAGGGDVALITDSEAGKTTGLVARLQAEARACAPRADVFWSGELFQTILLARRGLLARYEPTTAQDIPSRFRDAENRWTAVALRARVLAFDPARTPATSRPDRWEQLADPEMAPHVVIANPLFGTTHGHVAAMFALWGDERARTFLLRLRENGVSVLDGNSATVRAVMAGTALLAATDTDDVWVAQRSGATLDLSFPDMGDGGTLVIPCSVALIAGGPNPDAARRLVDYLVSAGVERMLARSDSRNIPVRESLRAELNLQLPPASTVDFERIADQMDAATVAVREILLR